MAVAERIDTQPHGGPKTTEDQRTGRVVADISIRIANHRNVRDPEACTSCEADRSAIQDRVAATGPWAPLRLAT